MIKRKLDLLYLPAAPQLLAYTELKLPVIFMTDISFQQIQGYYDTWQNFSPSNISQGIEPDQLAFQKQPIVCWRVIGVNNLPSTITD